MGIDHYENFPVGSLFLPKNIRPAVHAIYRFARAADDIADEGEFDETTRLQLLGEFRHRLQHMEAGETLADDAIFSPLFAEIRRHSLPFAPFYDLISAFEQDVTVKRYADYAALADYCRRSANPIGRLMLHLFGEHDRRALAMSDAVCTALQLINFLQDIDADFARGRVYIPQADLEKFAVTEAQIANRDATGLWSMLMRFEVARARKLLAAGAPLGKLLPGRLGFEVRMIIMGGERILKKLHDNSDIFQHRPILQKRDWLYMVYRALWVK